MALNPRMASLPHCFEEPGDEQDIRLVVDTIPTLAWSTGPVNGGGFWGSAGSACVRVCTARLEGLLQEVIPEDTCARRGIAWMGQVERY
jgi:hypothetical protein